MSFGKHEWPVMLAVDILGSAADDTFSYYYYDYAYSYGYNEDVDFHASTFELDLGARKTWEFANSNIRPYIGGGLAGISGHVSVDVDTPFGSASDSQSDTGLGYWVGGGIYWKLGQKLNLGFNARYSSADVEFDRFDTGKVDAGGTHVGLLLGWGF
jgi:opacity protein-like surface antigen